jgi:hypothetical protein
MSDDSKYDLRYLSIEKGEILYTDDVRQEEKFSNHELQIFLSCDVKELGLSDNNAS